MSKRKRYSPEYRHEAVELVRRAGSSCRQVAQGRSPGADPYGRNYRIWQYGEVSGDEP